MWRGFVSIIDMVIDGLVKDVRCCLSGAAASRQLASLWTERCELDTDDAFEYFEGHEATG